MNSPEEDSERIVLNQRLSAEANACLVWYDPTLDKIHLRLPSGVTVTYAIGDSGVIEGSGIELFKVVASATAQLGIGPRELPPQRKSTPAAQKAAMPTLTLSDLDLDLQEPS